MSVNNSNLDASKTWTQVSSPVTPPLPLSPLSIKKPRRKRIIAISVLLFLLLLASGVSIFYFLTYKTSTTKTSLIAGHAFFISSGQGNDFSTMGINDELVIDLHNIPPPSQGKSYYAWLLNDTNQANYKAILLGALVVHSGQVQFTYHDPQQSDLLQTHSRLLITEEEANITPSNPSPDHSTWRYTAELAQTADPADTINHYSLLDHLRFLLSEDPLLKQMGVAGGLNTSFLRNTGSILQWAGSARDYWNTRGADAIHGQMIRILDYLDGVSSVEADVPPGTHVIVDKRLASIALLGTPSSNNSNQLSSDYLDLIDSNISAITSAPGITKEQHALAVEINADLNNMRIWLENVRVDAKTLVIMSNAQLLLPSSLSILDDMQTQAFDAYAGRLDPATNQIQEGVVQINFALQRLATFDITPFSIQ
jgi:hypothetical protein